MSKLVRKNSMNTNGFSAASMHSLNQLFHKNIFRIPDYQRGYSWGNDEIDDFWQDLLNLQENHQHYTGMITIETVEPRQMKRWSKEKWLINQGCKPYYVVDGQQRLTTIIILIQTLIEYLESNQKYLSYSKRQIVERYLYKRSANNNLIGYYFGYEIDDPSYEY